MGEEEHGPARASLQAHWEHAQFVWAAEEENARRIATRKALIVGVPLAAAAFSPTIATPVSEILHAVAEGSTAGWVGLVAGLLAAASLCGVLVKALPIQKTRVVPYRHSSGNLNPIRENSEGYDIQQDIDRFLALPDEDARVETTARVLRASHELNSANRRANQRLQYALEFVVWALVASALAGMCYVHLRAPSHTKGPGNDATGGNEERGG